MTDALDFPTENIELSDDLSNPTDAFLYQTPDDLLLAFLVGEPVANFVESSTAPSAGEGSIVCMTKGRF